MVVLNVRYECKPGMLKAFYDAINEKGLADQSRAEEGNLKYAYAKALEEEDVLYLIENWKSREAFEEHKQMAHFKEIGQLKEQYVENTILNVYDV